MSMLLGFCSAFSCTFLHRSQTLFAKFCCDVLSENIWCKQPERWCDDSWVPLHYSMLDAEIFSHANTTITLSFTPNVVLWDNRDALMVGKLNSWELFFIDVDGYASYWTIINSMCSFPALVWLTVSTCWWSLKASWSPESGNHENLHYVLHQKYFWGKAKTNSATIYQISK